jgi:hypothetical protein
MNRCQPTVIILWQAIVNELAGDFKRELSHCLKIFGRAIALFCPNTTIKIIRNPIIFLKLANWLNNDILLMKH